MKYIVFILVLILSAKVLAQSGSVNYQKEIDTPFYLTKKGMSLKSKNPDAYARFEKIEKQKDLSMAQLRYTLLFSKEKSLFSNDDFMKKDGDNYLELALGPYTGKYYKDHIEKKGLWQMSAFNEEFLIALSPVEWTITDEHKEIMGYTCYKAYSNQSNLAEDDFGDFLVEAWFTPELPISSGPLGYGNLPGIILDLKLRNEHYFAIKIEYNPVELIQIQRPKTGKKIKFSELNAYANKLIPDK
ncbi:GLPGLI family protein [Leeuwenhoekiella aestuarii]|uniref:GLPGLI family protein n=1 Tax=Leeuwenhoekiella aestuarii TaxID=2249426 RepID=A0A4Q0NT10_9FLAO|nr:GLPGLI family protein [Leeuwenhoekiella aestuarii]RXG14229.1 GLPGLI family protein [Leeuwenhoekiella aestuarii]RXG18978.1 GLPGLI family protein [Leeuwenhoekiella aestuarii]